MQVGNSPSPAPPIRHLDNSHHWEVDRDNQLVAVANKRTIFSRFASWITGSSSPQKVFQEFKKSIELAPQTVSAKDLIKYKQDIEIEYPGTRSNYLVGRLIDAMLWRGDTINAKEEAINATYQRLDNLFFGGNGQYNAAKANELSCIQYRRDLEGIYAELITPTPDLERLNSLLESHHVNLPSSKGPWLTKFADLDYPGAQFILADALSDPAKADQYGLPADPEAAARYGKAWIASIGVNPDLMMRGVDILSRTEQSHSMVQRLLTQIIFSSTADENLRAEAYTQRGLIKIGFGDQPRDQLQGYQDLIEAAKIGSSEAVQALYDLQTDALENGRLLPPDLNTELERYTTNTTERRAEILRLKGPIMINHPDPSEQLLGWQNLIKAAELGNSTAIQIIREKEMDALTNGNLFPIPPENWPAAFSDAHRAEIELLHGQIWDYTTRIPENYTLALSLRSALLTKSPLDHEKINGWEDLIRMAELDSPEAKQTIYERAKQALENGDHTPIPTIGDDAPVQTFMEHEENKTTIRHLSARLWIIAADQEADLKQKRLLLKKAVLLGSFEAARKIEPLLQSPSFYAYAMKIILEQEPVDSPEYQVALDELHAFAVALQPLDPKTAAEHFLFLTERGHEPARQALAELGLEKRPDLKEDIKEIYAQEIANAPLLENPLINNIPLNIDRSNYVIARMLADGIILNPDPPKSIEFFKQALEVPAASIFAASLLPEDKQDEAIELLVPMLVKYPASTALGREAREVLESIVKFPLSEPPPPGNVTKQRLPLINAKEALYSGGLRLWNSPIKNAFHPPVDQIPDLIPDLVLSGDIRKEFENANQNPIAIANTMKYFFETLNPKLWDENSGILLDERNELFQDLITFLHNFSKLESGTEMSARRLAEAWIPYLIPGEATEEKIQELTTLISEGIQEE